jgi:hypothetical protein
MSVMPCYVMSCHVSGRMDGWMDGWMEGGKEGWNRGQVWSALLVVVCLHVECSTD